MYVLPSHRISLVEDGKRSQARGWAMVSHSRGCQPDLARGSVSLLRRMFEWGHVNWVRGARLVIAALGIAAAVLDSCGVLPYP